MFGSRANQQLMGTVVVPINAINFDRAGGDNLSKAADLDSNADGKVGIFSGWVNFDENSISASLYRNSSFNHIAILRDSANAIAVIGKNAATSFIMDLDTGTNVTDWATRGWTHILCSWDLSVGSRRWIYIDDTSQLANVNTFTNDTIDYTRTPHAIAFQVDGCMSEIYFNNETFLDLSVESNRRKFITAALEPVDLGADGSTPTGAAPRVYMKDPAATAGTNSGDGGDFTINGTLDDCGTTP